MGSMIEDVESDMTAALDAESDNMLGDLDLTEGSTDLVDLATSASDSDADVLPEPSGLVSEGIGMLTDIQIDQPLGGGLFG